MAFENEPVVLDAVTACELADKAASTAWACESSNAVLRINIDAIIFNVVAAQGDGQTWTNVYIYKINVHKIEEGSVMEWTN